MTYEIIKQVLWDPRNAYHDCQDDGRLPEESKHLIELRRAYKEDLDVGKSNIIAGFLNYARICLSV